MSDSDFLTILRVLDRWKKFIIGIVGVTAAVSIILSFFLPKWYAARSSVIPPRESEIGSIASLVQGIALPGIGALTPTSAESQLFLAILDSRTLREGLIRKYDLMTRYRAKTMDDALKVHGHLARVDLTDRGVVEVIVEDRDPKIAAAMANDWVTALDQFNRDARMTAGKKGRLFIEGRIEDTKLRLNAAEESLSSYQSQHKDLPMTADVTSAIESGASLMARRMALQVQLNLMTDLYQENSPQVEKTRAELAAIDRQLESLPELGVEFARRIRDVKVQEQVYALLMAQYEEARIRENRDTPTLDILDSAVPPDRRIRPIRWLFCTSLTLSALILTVGTAFTAEFLRDLRGKLAAATTRG